MDSVPVLALNCSISEQAFNLAAGGPLELLRWNRASMLNQCLRNLDLIGDSRDNHGRVRFIYGGRWGDDEHHPWHLWQLSVEVTPEQWSQITAWWNAHRKDIA